MFLTWWFAFPIIERNTSEAATEGILLKKVFLKIPQYLQENTCFHVNIEKFLRTPILKNICERLLLNASNNNTIIRDFICQHQVNKTVKTPLNVIKGNILNCIHKENQLLFAFNFIKSMVASEAVPQTVSIMAPLTNAYVVFRAYIVIKTQILLRKTTEG